MIIQLQVEGSSYDFNLVTAFLPNYKSHEKLPGAEIIPEYTFQYTIEVNSS